LPNHSTTSGDHRKPVLFVESGVNPGSSKSWGCVPKVKMAAVVISR
jgi:hypothetical protein